MARLCTKHIILLKALYTFENRQKLVFSIFGMQKITLYQNFYNFIQLLPYKLPLACTIYNFLLGSLF